MKRKKINRSILFLSLCGVFVTIVAMSVVYAALSSKLLIDGSAEIPNSSFGLKVEKFVFSDEYGDEYVEDCPNFGQVCNDNYVLEGKGSIISQPVISGTTISNFNLGLELPGDMVAIGYKITNEGTIPMKLIDIIENEFQITSLNNSSEDIAWANENVIFGTLNEKYDVSDSSENGTDVNINDILCPGDSWSVSLVVMIPDEVDTIPSGALEISNVGVKFDFVQTDQYLCEDK